MPTERRTDRETTSKLELKKLANRTGDEFYKRVVEMRELTKLKSTYVEGFVPATDGGIHSHFGHETGTGQLTSHRPNVQNCFSGDTEILTRNGWIAFERLPGGIEVAQYDSSTRAISFVLPERIVAQHADALLHIHTKQQIDLLVTPDHECLVLNRRTGRWEKVPALLYPSDHLQLHAGQYVGGPIAWRDSQIVLIAALQADGHVRADGRGFEFCFGKPRKIERLLSALEDESIEHKLYPHGEQTRIYVPDRAVPGWWRDKKYFGAWLLEMDATSFRRMADEVFFWDGCWTRRSNYSSNEKENADWVQMLQILTGRRARLRRYGHRNWQVDVSQAAHSITTNRKVESVPGKAPVYCVTVPAGNVIVRRYGRVAITGNCPKVGHGGAASKNFKALAGEFRSMIEARPEHWLVEFDYKSAHALTLGFEAQDPDYMRIARIDMHSFLAAAGLLRLEDPDKLLSLSDAELKARLKWYRKNWRDKTGRPFEDIRNVQAKPAILGYGFAMGPGTLFHNNPESFRNIGEAKRVIQTLDRLFLRQPQFRRRIRELGAKQSFLVSRHGYIRWFFDVGYWDRVKARWVAGDDAEACIAFLPANDAFGHIKDAMLRLEEQGWNQRAQLINQIHDALMFHVPDSLMDDALPAIKAEMERRSEILIDPVVAPEGLMIETSVSVGRNWGAMEEIDLQTGWAKRAA